MTFWHFLDERGQVTGVPLWIAVPGWEPANGVPNDRALAAGLALRPLAETIEAALADETTLTLEVGLTAEREAEFLAARE